MKDIPDRAGLVVMNDSEHFCTRCAAVIVEEGRFLLTGHFDAAGLFFWTFPGGLQRDGETPEQAAAREAWEETGLTVHIDKLLYTLEWELPVGCKTELYFLASPEGGTLTSEHDPHSFGERPRPLLWVPFDEMDDLPFRPGELKVRLPQDAGRGFRGAAYSTIRFRD